MQTFKVEFEVRLTDEDILDMPIASGNDYWARIFLTDGGFAVYEKDDWGETDQYFHTVKYDDIRNAFARLVANQNLDGKPYHIASYILGYFTQSVRDGEDGGIDVGAIDTDATDVLLQVAIWDEVING